MIKKYIETVIFASKWLLIPFYIRLCWTLIVLLYHFFPDGHINNDHLMETLEAVDIVMVANLVKMIITGSYNSFVDKFHGVEGEQVSSGALKVKMATSIMGVSSMHLLKTFVGVGILTEGISSVSWDVLLKQSSIHVIFIIGAYVLAKIDFLHCKSEKHEATPAHNH